MFLAFLCFLVCPLSHCEEATDFTPAEPEKVVKTKKPFLLVCHNADDLTISYGLFPQERHPSGNRIGVGFLMSSKDDSEEDSPDMLYFAYCTCKCTENTYDMYSILIPASMHSHVFHSKLTIKDDKLILTDTWRGSEIKHPSNTYFSGEKTQVGILPIIEAHKGKTFDIVMQRLRTICSVHSEQGRKKVKSVLGELLQEDKAKASKFDYDESEDSSERTAHEPEEGDSEGEPTMPITVQNNLEGRVKVEKKKSVAIIKESSSYVYLAWMIELSNRTSNAIEQICVEHFTISKDDFKLENSMEIIKNLKPEETRKVRGTEMIEKQMWEKAASHEFVID